MKKINKHYILTGAGFTKDFGGKVSSELWQEIWGHRLAQDNEAMRDLLWDSRNEGFENALSKAVGKEFYQDLENIIIGIFNNMDKTIYKACQYQPWMKRIQQMFGICDTIYTTNQDLFVERWNIATEKPSTTYIKEYHLRSLRFKSPHVDMRVSNNLLANHTYSSPEHINPVLDSECYNEPYVIDYIKLHGSINFYNEDKKSLMIQGTQKLDQINNNDIFRQYFERFKRELTDDNFNNKILIIGHSLLDKHINDILINAVENHGLKLYIWNRSKLENIMKNMVVTLGLREGDKTIEVSADEKRIEAFVRKGLIGYSNNGIKQTLEESILADPGMELRRIRKEFLGENYSDFFVTLDKD